MSGLAARLARASLPPAQNVTYRHGRVVGYHPANPPVPASVDVLIDGVTLPTLPFLGNAGAWLPAVGQEVELLQIGDALLVIGTA